MSARRLVSNHYPYVPITIAIERYRASAEAFLDTGFEGNLLVPTGFLPPDLRPANSTTWTMPDGRRVVAPTYWASVQIGDLGIYNVLISALGDEVLIGRRLIDRFVTTLDRGQRLIITL